MLWLLPVAVSLVPPLLNPTEYATLQCISIAAGRVAVNQQDPRFAMVLPAQEQKLPLSYVAEWPIWIAQAKAGSKLPVTKIPTSAAIDGVCDSWVPPAAFEQHWMPDDLPVPSAAAAVGLVLRNGEPRYVFPTVDAYVELDGELWRNRGLNSVPVAKTWLHYGELPVDELRLSGSMLPYAPPHEGEEQPQAAKRSWEECLPSRPVAAAIDAAFDALDALPQALRKTSLGDGYCYLISPLETEDGGRVLLPDAALAPGGRLRLFLSAADDDSADWQRGELDLTSFRLPPGKDSPYMQEVYAPLFNRES